MNGRILRSCISAVSALALASALCLLTGCPNSFQGALLQEIKAEVAAAAGAADSVKPIIGTALVVGTVGQETAELSWGAASDNKTAPEGLTYRVVRASSSGELATAEIALQQNVVMDWTAAATSHTATGLSPDTDYWFAVLVRDGAGNTSLYAPKPVHTLNASAPTPGSGPAFTSITQTSLTVSWGAGTDDTTPQASLQYKLVRADSAEAIDTAAEADAVSGSDLILNWSANTLTANVSGLSVYTLYYFAVVVKDGAGNLALYAPKSVRTLGAQYTVSFDAQGGSAAVPATKSVNYGSPYGTLATTSRTGYTLAGWWTGAGGTGQEVTASTTVTATSNHTLYAKWVANTYTVTFDAQGGSTPSPASKSVTYGSMYGALATSTRTGYILDGWWTGTGGTGTQITAATTVTITANQTLYAKWSAAPWARVPTAGTNYTQFAATAVDGSGNVYAAGYQMGTGSFTYGTGVSVAGPSTGYNAVVVKYSTIGTAVWAVAPTAGSTGSWFKAVAVDSSGSVYAAGYQVGTGTYTYGGGVSATGSGTGQNAVVVKYNSSGAAQWARTVSAGSSDSIFYGLAVDSGGNVYAVGCQKGIGNYTYGASVTVAGTSNDLNVVAVKYDSSGNAQWARSTTSGTPADSLTEFFAAAVDSSGNLYAAGYQYRGATIYYSGTVSATGSCSYENISLVKYNSSGTAQWARTTSGGDGSTQFNAVATDSSGNIYAAGYQRSWITYTYGTGVTATAPGSYKNALVVKYNDSGTAQWARTVSAGPSDSERLGISVDSSGNIYTSGFQGGTGTFTYGSGVSASGTSSVANVSLVKYDSSGTALWARTLEGGTSNAVFLGCAADALGGVYAAGYQQTTGTYTYNTGVSATGLCSVYNSVLVKYTQ